MSDSIIFSPSSLAYGGDAFGRLPDGRAVFAPFALPGEVVRAQITEQKKGFVRAELVEIVEPSPLRIQPRCSHHFSLSNERTANICGGCHYQHMDYPAQLVAKTDILREQLERIGGMKDIPLHPMISSPHPWQYRNHVQFHLSPEGKLGFQDRFSNQPFAIRECYLPEEVLDQIWSQLDIEPLPGLERIGLRLGDEDEIMLVLESRDPQPLEFSVEELPLSAVYAGPGGALVLAGSPHLTITVLEKAFRVSAASFFQINTQQAGNMVNYLLENLPLDGSQTVLDVYCGVGLFSGFLAPRVGRLVGIEASASACEDFVYNLEQYNHVELYEAEAETVLNSVDFFPQVMILDPPRTGLGHKTLDGILRQNPDLLAYISCDPATLARDARRLTAGGYRLMQIIPVDMFPQTYHIESISIWKKAV